MKKIKSIELTFENCDFITIDASDVDFFLMTGFNTFIHNIEKDLIIKEAYVSEVYIEFLKEADKEYYEFGNIDDDEYKNTVFNKIVKDRDITHISITYNDDSEEFYIINYEEEAGFGSPNKNEDVAISESGNVYVVISDEGKTVKDIFHWVFKESKNKE